MKRVSVSLLSASVFFSAGVALAQTQPGGESPLTEEPAETPPPSAAPAPAAPVPATQPAAVQYAPYYAPPAPSSAPPAAVDTAPEEPLAPALPPGWFASIGVRTEYISHTGFDAFAENDALVQGSINFSRRVWSESALSVAGALEFDFGSRNATARGEVTTLDTWRLTLGPEVRWNLIPQLFGYVRPSAGVSRSVASLADGMAQTTLYARSWDIAVDGAAGVAFAFWDLRSRSGDLRFWLLGEGGYAWTNASDLQLSPDEGSGAPERTEPLDLGELALRGPYFKVAIAASF